MPTLTGKYLHGDGTPRVGALRFSPSVTIVGDDTIILPAPFQVPLVDGEFTVTDMVACDDPAYAPTGWVWTVEERLAGGRTWSFELTGDADLSDLTPVSVPDAYTIYATAGALADHEAATAGVHGIADTADLVTTDDARLSDARTPTSTLAHKASHATGGSDALAAADIGAAATSHAHAPGDVAGTAVVTGDARLSDARTPTAHAASHAAAGADPVTLTESQITGLTAALAAKVAASLFDANTILAATADNTPAALTIPASTLVGRGSTGNIAALTAAQARTLLAVAVTHPSTDDVVVKVYDDAQARAQTVHADTGWRVLAAGDAANTTDWDASQIRIRRIGWTVFVTGYSIRKTVGAFGGTQDHYLLPLGFRPGTSSNSVVLAGLAWSSSVYWPCRLSVGQQTANTISTISVFGLTGSPANWAINDRAQLACSFATNDAWPSSLPGTLVSAAPA